jgi:hypothetical protein
VQVTVKETNTAAWVRLPDNLVWGASGEQPMSGFAEQPDRPTTVADGGVDTLRTALPPATSGSKGDVARQIHQRLAATWNRPVDVMTVTAHNLDHIHQVDLIAPDYEAAVEEPRRHAGGSGANTATGLALLGLRSAAMGVIADDPDGLVLEQALRKAAVDTSRLLVVPTPRS